MHVIERTERFTLVGADARRGKLTLFDAEAPREPGVPAPHRPARIVAGRRRRPLVDLGEGLEVVLVEGETDVEFDLDHVGLVSADPAGSRCGVEGVRLRTRRGETRVEVGGAFIDISSAIRAAPSGRS